MKGSSVSALGPCAGTASRIGGVSFEQLAADQLRLHAMAYERQERDYMLPDPGEFHFRRGGGMLEERLATWLHTSCSLRCERRPALE
jgi:hypothetical protein